MAHLNGHSAVAYGVGGPTGGMAAAPAAAAQPGRQMDAARGIGAINGVPVRIVVLAFAAAAGLTALRMAGFRFNVGVSA